MGRTASRSSSRNGVYSLGESLDRLMALGDRAGWVVSCYQKLEPSDRVKKRYRIKVKNRLRAALERLDGLGPPAPSRAEREGVVRDLERIERFFSHPSNLAGGRGVAIFAADRVKLFEALPLPYVLRSRVVVDRTPLLSELVALEEHGSRLLAVVVDRRSARCFAVGPGGGVELPELRARDAVRPGRFHGARGDAPGVGEHNFHNRIREERHRHLARVAESVTARLGAELFDGLIVGGIGVEADALLPHLRPRVRERVLGVVHLAPKQVSPAALHERASQFVAQAAERHARAAVAELAELLPERWATDGIVATLRALERGQVRVLLADGDASVPGFRCRKSGRLVSSAQECQDGRDPIPVADVIDDAIEDGLRQRADVAVLHGAAARRFDRLAALLRFRLSR